MTFVQADPSDDISLNGATAIAYNQVPGNGWVVLCAHCGLVGEDLLEGDAIHLVDEHGHADLCE